MTPAQPSLFDTSALPPIVQVPSAGLTRAQRLMAYHEANPHVYQLFRHMAYADMVGGHLRLYAMEYIYAIRKAGIRAIQDVHGYKIPNDLATFYVRMLIAESPRFDELFETRPSELDDELTTLLEAA